MTTDEARVIICGSITQIFRENGNKLLKEALEVAIAALEQPAPVYHYLPEVPKNNEWVLGYFENWVGGEECQYHGGEWYDHVGMPMKNTPYAWTRIPPKPPVKPKEVQPHVCPLCDGKGRRVFPNCTPPIDKPCEGCEGAGILQTINEKGGSHE